MNVKRRAAKTSTSTSDASREALEHLQTFPAWILASIINNQIDVQRLVGEELAARGLDTNGRWIGFKEAARLHKTDR